MPNHFCAAGVIAARSIAFSTRSHSRTTQSPDASSDGRREAQKSRQRLERVPRRHVIRLLDDPDRGNQNHAALLMHDDGRQLTLPANGQFGCLLLPEYQLVLGQRGHLGRRFVATGLGQCLEGHQIVGEIVIFAVQFPERRHRRLPALPQGADRVALLPEEAGVDHRLEQIDTFGLQGVGHGVLFRQQLAHRPLELVLAGVGVPVPFDVERRHLQRVVRRDVLHGVRPTLLEPDGRRHGGNPPRVGPDPIATGPRLGIGPLRHPLEKQHDAAAGDAPHRRLVGCGPALRDSHRHLRQIEPRDHGPRSQRPPPRFQHLHVAALPLAKHDLGGVPDTPLQLKAIGVGPAQVGQAGEQQHCSAECADRGSHRYALRTMLTAKPCPIVIGRRA